MPSRWPSVKIDRFLQQITDTEELEPDHLYRLLGVRLEGKGPFVREEKLGAQVRTKKLRKVNSGEFIYSRLFAWRGAFGLISDKLDGGYVSNEFPTFEIDESQVSPRFLELYFNQQWVWDEVETYCTGTTKASRNRFKEKFFLNLEIPLPPLEQQKRIVAKIESLVARVEEAQKLNAESVEEAEKMFDNALNEIWVDITTWDSKPIDDLVKTVSGQVLPTVEPYLKMPHINGENIVSGRCKLLPYQTAEEDGVMSGKYHFKAGSILYSKIRPYLRKAVQVPVEGICSADIYAFEYIDPVLEPRFFMYSLIAQPFTDYANERSGRTRMPKLNQKQLYAFKLSYPPLSEQRRIVTYLDGLQARVDELKQLQTETQQELAELVPSILDKAFKGEL